ncbi:hypothetical protein PHMEG_0002470 [Phytophthora megakarya]|uniref:Uncharacterized protein n=1 Tax=Phytophthora megakarya TaxID=4795 RepID=A0A225WYZ0_9STRA|nr:hypothetical protein PHMEG_0002470 [Phytophthora megakarya]
MQNSKNLATYVFKKQVADVPDTHIMRAVQGRCHTLKNGFVPDVTSLFRQNLLMDLPIDGCDERIFRYYEDIHGIMEDNGLQGLIEHAKVQQRFHRISQDYATTGDSKLAKRERKLQKPSSANASAKTGVTLADGRPQMCGMEVVLDLELVMIAKSVSLRSILPCLILERDGDQFLLGKDALKRLGIDVDQVLAQLTECTLLADEDDEFPVGAELPT